MVHGFDLDRALHRQLRGLVPSQALKWVEQETGHPVVAQSPLEGGQSAALHRLRLEGGAELVIRRLVLDWVADEPWAASNEATVLDLLRDTAVPAPALVAVDSTGSRAGVPTVLMTMLPGEVVWEPDDPQDWLDALVSVIMTIHEVPVAASLRAWEVYPPEGVPPTSSAHHGAWEQANAAYHAERPVSDRVFLHRDFHPGNLLWVDGAVTGVVDWISSCAGPPEEDIAHCRCNLARHHGQQVADEFLARWMRATGRTDYHPYWDLLDAVSMGAGQLHPRLDEFVAAAAARL